MKRTSCVVCMHTPLDPFFIEKQFPIVLAPSILTPESDLLADYCLEQCPVCKCIQSVNLIDPSIIYKNNHNVTYNTPTWKAHHIELSNFICDGNKKERIMEVGGYPGILASHILRKEPTIDYTLLDLCDKIEEISPSIHFLNGNCEEFNYKGYDTIILSHVFEHLYNPLHFIKRAAESGVKYIYISLPNMTEQVNTNNIFILSNEHTFFCNEYFTEYMFQQYGYECETKHMFRDHSIFFRFKFTSLLPEVVIPQVEISSKLASVIKNVEQRLRSIKTDSECFIAPAGHFGQKIYHYIKDKNPNILGFIDNDKSKIGKRSYGSDKTIFSPDILKDYKDRQLNIIIYAGPYLKEIKKQFNDLHPSLDFIEV